MRRNPKERELQILLAFISPKTEFHRSHERNIEKYRKHRVCINHVISIETITENLHTEFYNKNLADSRLINNKSTHNIRIKKITYVKKKYRIPFRVILQRLLYFPHKQRNR